MNKNLFLVFFFAAFLLSTNAQESRQFSIEELEVKMRAWSIDMLEANQNELRKAAADSFLLAMRLCATRVEAFHYPFEKITTLSKLTSPDKKLRVLTWLYPTVDASAYFIFGMVLVNQWKGKPYQAFELTDKRVQHEKPMFKVLKHTDWHGAFYYHLVQTKHKHKTYYTLLGYDGNNQRTQKKWIEVITLNAQNQPMFGATIFEGSKKPHTRVGFEYTKETTMLLRYDEKNKRIVFDHLSPSDPKFTGMFETYGPDLSVDAFEWKEGKWRYIKDIDARNSDQNKGKQVKAIEKGLFGKED